MFQKLFKMYCKIIPYSSPQYTTPAVAGKKKKFCRLADQNFLFYFFFVLLPWVIQKGNKVQFSNLGSVKVPLRLTSTENSSFSQLCRKFPSLTAPGAVSSPGMVDKGHGCSATAACQILDYFLAGFRNVLTLWRCPTPK